MLKQTCGSCGDESSCDVTAGTQRERALWAVFPNMSSLIALPTMCALDSYYCNDRRGNNLFCQNISPILFQIASLMAVGLSRHCWRLPLLSRWFPPPADSLCYITEGLAASPHIHKLHSALNMQDDSHGDLWDFSLGVLSVSFLMLSRTDCNYNFTQWIYSNEKLSWMIWAIIWWKCTIF